MSDVDDVIDVVSGNDGITSLINVLKTRAPKLATAVAAGYAVWPAVNAGRQKLRDSKVYSVKISGADEAYDEIHEWVLGLLKPDARRALIAYSRYTPSHDGEYGGPWLSPVGLRYDGTREQVVTVSGHRIRVLVTANGKEAEGREGGAWKPPEITLTAQSAAGRDAVIAELVSIVTRMREQTKRPSVKVLSEWGWERLADLPPRPLDSVILPAGQSERITADMRQFLGAEAEYVRRGIPWHRGYLFEGPPGTGKTSITRALAGHFKMDLWYLPLGDVYKDGSLLQRVAQISPRSVLLLEDVDVFVTVQQRKSGGKDGQRAGERASLAGLLNAVDGVATPHGLITVMTANQPVVLDQALVRPGRVDLTEHFGPCTSEQAFRMLSYFYGRMISDDGTLGGVLPAQVTEVCKRHPGNAALTQAQLRRKLRGQVAVGPQDVNVKPGLL